MSHSHQTPKIFSYVLNNFPAVFITIPIITVKWSINLYWIAGTSHEIFQGMTKLWFMTKIFHTTAG